MNVLIDVKLVLQQIMKVVTIMWKQNKYKDFIDNKCKDSNSQFNDFRMHIVFFITTNFAFSVTRQ